MFSCWWKSATNRWHKRLISHRLSSICTCSSNIFRSLTDWLTLAWFTQICNLMSNIRSGIHLNISLATTHAGLLIPFVSNAALVLSFVYYFCPTSSFLTPVPPPFYFLFGNCILSKPVCFPLFLFEQTAWTSFGSLFVAQFFCHEYVIISARS